MPIRVHCPNGCLIRMPASRAGRVVRCPECKATIELPPVSESEQRSGKPIPISARLFEAPLSESASSETTEFVGLPQHRFETKIERADEFVAETTSDIQSITERADESAATIDPADIELREKHLTDSNPISIEYGISKSRLEIPTDLTPEGIVKKEAQHKAKLKEILASVEPVTSKDITVLAAQPKPIRTRRVKPPDIPDSFALTPPANNQQETNWQTKVYQSNLDRVVLSRFFAVTLCLIAVVNMMPAIFHWFEWYHSVEFNPLPRWIYLQIFIAGIHFIYAVFIFQIPDWSTLRAVSVAMLGIAFVFGMISTALLLGGGQSTLTTFLGLSYMFVKRAALWCVAMLCLSTLMCYWGGREASHWQRAEQLLIEFLGPSKIQGL